MFGALGEWGEGGQRVVAQLGGQRLGTAGAEQADVGRLVLRRILARGLAQRGGAGLGVEDVVDDLEQQADAVGEMGETGQCRIIGIAAMRAEQHGGADQRAGLVDVHLLEFGQRQRLADGGEVDGLAAGHAARAGSVGEQATIGKVGAGGTACRAFRPAPGRPATAARRRPAAPWLRRIRHAPSACRGAGCRRPCRAGRHAPANRRGSVRRRRRHDRVRRRAHRTRRRRHGRAGGARACRRPARRSAWRRAGVPAACRRAAGTPPKRLRCGLGPRTSSRRNSWSGALLVPAARHPARDAKSRRVLPSSRRIFCSAPVSASWQWRSSAAPRS